MFENRVFCANKVLGGSLILFSQNKRHRSINKIGKGRRRFNDEPGDRER